MSERPPADASHIRLTAHDSRLITSVHNETIARIRSLHRRKGRKAQGAFLVEGPRAVMEAIATHTPLRLLAICPDMLDTDERAGFSSLGVPTLHVSEVVMKSLADTGTPQGVIAVAD